MEVIEAAETQQIQCVRFVHTAGVAGSIPAAPTMKSPQPVRAAGFFFFGIMRE